MEGEDCRNYSYDEDEDEAGCLASLDEDDLSCRTPILVHTGLTGVEVAL